MRFQRKCNGWCIVDSAMRVSIILMKDTGSRDDYLDRGVNRAAVSYPKVDLIHSINMIPYFQNI